MNSDRPRRMMMFGASLTGVSIFLLGIGLFDRGGMHPTTVNLLVVTGFVGTSVGLLVARAAMSDFNIGCSAITQVMVNMTHVQEGRVDCPLCFQALHQEVLKTRHNPSCPLYLPELLSKLAADGTFPDKCPFCRQPVKDFMQATGHAPECDMRDMLPCEQQA